MELTQLESVELFTVEAVTSQTVYLNVLFPSKYRYYFEIVSNVEIPILIEHPFRLYFPQTIMVSWVPPDDTSGVYLTLESSPEFMPFESLSIQLYIPQEIYDAIVQAFLNPINSIDELVPPPNWNACGEVEFVLLSTDTGEQIKIDLVNTFYVPEVPVTVQTLKWREVLYEIIRLFPPSPPSPPLLPPPLFLPPPPTFPFLSTTVWGVRAFSVFPWDGSVLNLKTVSSSRFSIPSLLAMDSSSLGFAYTRSGDLGITFIDPRYCFLREWITFPAAWTEALKNFAGIQ